MPIFYPEIKSSKVVKYSKGSHNNSSKNRNKRKNAEDNFKQTLDEKISDTKKDSNITIENKIDALADKNALNLKLIQRGYKKRSLD